jgi:hypothetical protein
MHDASLANSVLSVLRRHPGPHRLVRVHVGDADHPVELAERLLTQLAAADPPLTAAAIEVVPRARPRICASCATAWTSTEPQPACPACAGAPLPLPHDHTIEVELLD